MSIVQLSVSVLAGAKPSTLQQTGAIISQGATSLNSGTYGLITQVSDLTSILAPALTLTSLTWSGGIVTAAASANIPGLTAGDTFLTTISGASPTAYNGQYTATVTGAATFTYALASNPGTETSAGTYTPPSQNYVQLAVNDFFSQGTSRAVYILELGPGDSTTGPTALSTFIAANPGFFYSYLVPKNWDAASGFVSLIGGYKADTSKTYFFVTTTNANYSQYTGNKAVQTWIEAPGVSASEFDAAEAFQASLSYAPSVTNQLTPFAYKFLNNATPYPQQGNAAQLATWDTANVNYVDTAAEGGLSNAMVSSGAMMDGNDFSYWYSVDNLQINAQQVAANTVIEGSQNSVNPLWYDQDGINRLQDAEVQFLNQSLAAKLTTGTVLRTSLPQDTFLANLQNGVYQGMNVVNAVPFNTYLNANPGDYATGTYNGLTIAYIPSRGFKHILIGVEVTNFVAAA